MNKNGSVLTITLVFVIVFMIMGLAVIHHAGLQLTAAEDREASIEAFWLADGAVEIALGKLKINVSDIIPKGQASVTSPRSQTNPASGGTRTYDVFSYADSCPPPLCSDAVRSEDPMLPVCTVAERSMDPILCDLEDRSSDSLLCLPSQRVIDPTQCTAVDMVDDGTGTGNLVCSCVLTSSCNMLCPCDISGTCLGRCSCEYQGEDPCVGRCPCELNDPPDCPCHLANNCPDNMIGRCPCEYMGSCCESWAIQSYGEVDYGSTVAGKDVQSRAVLAKVAQDLPEGYDINKALESWGFVNKDKDCEPDGNSNIEGGCEQHSDFTFENTLGEDKAFFDGIATHTYNDPLNNFSPIAGVTVINLTDKKSLNITEDKQLYDADGIPIASLLIIDATGVEEGKNVMITIAGDGVFRGIVWIIGEAQLVGTSNIYGAVFIAGEEDEVTKVSGTSDIYFSMSAIIEAIGTFDSDVGGENNPPGNLTFMSWEEIGIGQDKSEYE